MADTPAPPPSTPPSNLPPERLDEPEGTRHVPLTRRPWFQTVVPFATSLAFHVGIIVFCLLIAASVPAVRRALTQEQVIVPDAQIVDGAEVGGIPHPGLSGDPNRDAAQDLDETVKVSDSWAEQPSETLSNSLMKGQPAEGGGSLALGPNADVGKGLGQGAGGGGGKLAPFGLPGGGGGIGPKAPFMGASGNATKVVYCCDASGSMMLGGMKGSLFYEIKKAVSKLSPTQFFNVIFFQAGDATAMSKSGLQPANARVKEELAKYLVNQVDFKASSNPIPALRLAFKQNPQLIYLLTDGDFSMGSGVTNEQVLDEIKNLNPSGKVKINTIAFSSEENRDQPFVQVLKQIADQNGGNFAFVTQGDLQ